MQKQKCQVCKSAGAKNPPDATWKCPVCGAGVCDDCASNSDYQCGCIEIPNLVKIERKV